MHSWKELQAQREPLRRQQENCADQEIGGDSV